MIIDNKFIKNIETKKDRDIAAEVMIGFDGFVDKIYKPVKRVCNTRKEYYQKIDKFSDRLAAAAGISCDIDIDLKTIKPGGNAPLMAKALGELNVGSNLLAPTGGYKGLFEKFIPENCNIISTGIPAESIILEFKDGKVMLGNTKNFEKQNWNSLKKTAEEILVNDIINFDLIAMVNWSHFPHMTAIWSHLLDICKQKLSLDIADKNMLFVDISDPTFRPSVEIQEMLKLLSDFRDYFEVILGLNKNEALDLGKKLLNGEKNIYRIAEFIIDSGYASQVVIHPVASAILVTKNNSIRINVPPVEEPVISTGAGDNFNAGYCWARLTGFSSFRAIIIGAVTARLYVAGGRSPSLDDIYMFIKNNKEGITIKAISETGGFVDE
ncbi:MAG: PfkB family carbohydrate kinase [Halanaerobiales bacterium]